MCNIEFVDWMGLDDLRRETERADICLGIFGTSGKALRVIPHKVYAALAMGKPVVTADTPAAREMLEDGVSALLCPPGNPEALSACIRRLADDPALRAAISEKALELSKAVISVDVVSRLLAEAFPGPTGSVR